ncbi:MAG TPA: hypothetical protein VFQ44_16950 [Streptosporangiaceae bacterium]|nr:hypothetical protein [Streptosporangiaceae bacterium]
MTSTNDAPRLEAAQTHGQLMPARTVALWCLAILSIATSVIHFAVAGEHFAEYWLFGVFMLVTAWLQLLFAVAAVARPSRLLLRLGAVLNTGIIAVYIVTRTAGDVIGPTPNEVEPFGFGDGLCTVLEVIVVAGCVWLLAAKLGQRLQRRKLGLMTATIGAAAAILLSVALLDGGPEMVMASSAAAQAAGPAAAGQAGVGAAPASIELATRSPAGNITMPSPGMQMAPGMKMASSAQCATAPTAAQQKAAVSLVNAAWAGARRFRSLAVAKAAGYRPITPTGAPVVHYLNRGYYLSTVLGGPVLNTADPQSLVYANTPKGAVLAAAMYITAPHGATPQPGGCLTQWHVHTNLCLSRGLGVVGELDQANPACPAGSENVVTPAMMHVWFVPIPGGPTAVDAKDASVVRAAEQVPAPANGRA